MMPPTRRIGRRGCRDHHSEGTVESGGGLIHHSHKGTVVQEWYLSQPLVRRNCVLVTSQTVACGERDLAAAPPLARPTVTDLGLLEDLALAREADRLEVLLHVRGGPALARRTNKQWERGIDRSIDREARRDDDDDAHVHNI